MLPYSRGPRHPPRPIATLLGITSSAEPAIAYQGLPGTAKGYQRLPELTSTRQDLSEPVMNTDFLGSAHVLAVWPWQCDWLAPDEASGNVRGNSQYPLGASSVAGRTYVSQEQPIVLLEFAIHLSMYGKVYSWHSFLGHVLSRRVEGDSSADPHPAFSPAMKAIPFPSAYVVRASAPSSVSSSARLSCSLGAR
jgi:hypothetical protein